jgi:8-oxo-dGTP pyrophosphatase MutT (NUDIX family)
VTHWQPEITVAAIVERDSRFLFVEEVIAGRRVLNQPAGHVEDGESLLDAVCRETLEESAWRFTPEALVGIYLWRHPRSGRDTLRFTFCGAVHDHDPDRPLDHPVLATHWLTRTDVDARAAAVRSPVVLRCLEDYLAGRRLPLTALAEFTSPL